jgi:P27 family predicted phage terminase small subunit
VKPVGLPAAPKGLTPEARRWWRKLTGEYDIRDEGGLLLLETALTALDRMRQAQAQIAKDGPIVRDRWGQAKPHPATVVERDSRTGMLAALRAMHLDLEPLHKGPGRPGGS